MASVEESGLKETQWSISGGAKYTSKANSMWRRENMQRKERINVMVALYVKNNGHGGIFEISNTWRVAKAAGAGGRAWAL